MLNFFAILSFTFSLCIHYIVASVWCFFRLFVCWPYFCCFTSTCLPQTNRMKKRHSEWETMCRIQFVRNFCNFSFDITFARFTIKAAKLLTWETYKCWIVKNDEQNLEPMTEYWTLNQPILFLSFIIIKPNKQSKLINLLKHVLYSLHSLLKKELETCFWKICSFYAKKNEWNEQQKWLVLELVHCKYLFGHYNNIIAISEPFLLLAVCSLQPQFPFSFYDHFDGFASICHLNGMNNFRHADNI